MEVHQLRYFCAWRRKVTAFRENTITACRRSRLTPNVIFESGQFATILAMVAAGMGISIVPRMMRQKVEGYRFVRLEGVRNQRKIGTVRLGSHISSRAQQAFLEYLRQAAKAASNGAALFEISAQRAEIPTHGKRNRVAAAS